MNKRQYKKITSLINEGIEPKTITELLILSAKDGLIKDFTLEATLLSQRIHEFYSLTQKEV